MLDLNFILETLKCTVLAIPITLKLVFVTLIISIPLAYGIAIINLNPKRMLSKIFQVYISFVRSMPAVVIIFLIYYSIPLLLNSAVNKLGWNIDIYGVKDIVYGYIVFIFITVPSLSEVFRSGLLTVPKNQMEAAVSVGMTPFQAYIHIVIPQALQTSLPAMCNSVTSLIKMTSLAFNMSICEITGTARVIAAASIRYIDCYVVIFIVYLVLCMAVEQFFKYLERKGKRKQGFQTKEVMQ